MRFELSHPSVDVREQWEVPWKLRMDRAGGYESFS